MNNKKEYTEKDFIIKNQDNFDSMLRIVDGELIMKDGSSSKEYLNEFVKYSGINNTTPIVVITKEDLNSYIDEINDLKIITYCRIKKMSIEEEFTVSYNSDKNDSKLKIINGEIVMTDGSSPAEYLKRFSEKNEIEDNTAIIICKKETIVELLNKIRFLSMCVGIG